MTAVHPVKSEMSGAAPKAQSREPIDVDIIVSCRKREELFSSDSWPEDILSGVSNSARDQLQRFNKTGRVLGKGDVRVILMANALKSLSRGNKTGKTFEEMSGPLESTVEALFVSQRGA